MNSIKFNVEIADATGLIPATIFAEQAEQLYNITAAEMLNNTIDNNLSVEMIQKLSTPKNCTIMLRASMYTYGTINQCVFTVDSIFNPTSQQQPLAESSTQNLQPNTPKKRGAKPDSRAESPTNSTTMEEDAPIMPLKNKQKKE
ncbi:hypothetical protein RHMOL_Rhmol06G0232400 [Rhododendron molle]|uniref:Uncharacterized protein n=1 Tax=Rhododendron molle TaxID=49168 RepID=A0ACC0NFJ5_RHOML|nr:hypothetical protein RHMOL_Rhmol06G0232400 [Rhododendron molle]